ncbi:hypothetical protein BHM03_00033717 [Ensete ventricosum]|nr:hypothetical protein BHM03_00033717 [Ensete ventricosum]
MRPPSFVLLLVVLLPISLRASVASPLSTVAISRASNTTVVCAVVRSRTNDEYELSCTSLPMGLERTYTSGNISSSAIAGGEGFLCFLRLSTNVSTMVWWGFYQESDYYGSSRDYKRVYRGPPLADLSAGDSRVCGIHAGGRPICWRWNQLVFPEGVKLSDIAVGGDFVCGLLRGSMEIRCFGNDTGVVGHEPTGSYRMIAAGSRHACAVSRDGKLVCWGAGAPAMGATPSEISSLALGENKTCALGSQGRVTCWGERSSLPCGHNDTQFLAIQAKGSAICGILMVDYSLFCWGSDVFDHNPVVYANVLPGTCVPISSCRCGVLEGSGTLCDRGSAVCRLCEPEKISNPTASPAPSSPPPPPSTNRAGTSHKRRTAFVVIGSVGLAIGIAASFCFCLLHFGRCNGRVHDSGGMHSAAAGALPQGIASALARPHGSESAHTSIEWRFSSLVGRGCSPMLEEFPLSVLLAATDNFAESHKIGSGSFGSVYRATLDDGRVVAIKRAETSASTSKSPAGAAAAAAENKRHDKESAFLAELALLSRVNHKNLVSLLGYCKQGAERVLVYEFMTNGTLHDQLHKLPGASLASWSARLRVALDAARGLEYLHTYAVPPIIHRDIKSSNILLDDTWTAKVSDFGLSLMNPVDVEQGPVRTAGTVGYMDPEYYRLQHLTAKSDVYSFGVVLLELLTGCKVIRRYDDSSTPMNIVEFAVPHIVAHDIHRVLDPNLPPPLPSEIEAVTYVGYLAIDCVSPEGRERPTMTEVVNGLERAAAACDAPATSLDRSTTVRSI